MASIDQRPSGLWRAQVRRAGFRPKSKSFKTKREAEAWARKLESGIDSGEDLDLAELRRGTVEDVLDRFVRDEAPHRRGGEWDKTRIAYWKANTDWVKRRLDQHLVPALRLYFEQRLAQVSPETVNRDMNLLSGIFTVAIKKWGLPLSVNPVRQLARPAETNKGPGKLWAAEDLEKIRTTAAELGYGAGGRLVRTHDFVVPALELSLETAMRIGEVCSVQAADVDLPNRVLQLDMTKNGDWRRVPLSTRAVEILEPLIAAAEARLEKYQERIGSKAQLAGQIVPMSADVLGLRFRQLRAKAGVEGLRFHDTRHTAATMASKKLANVLELSAFTGHRSLQSLKRYYHADPMEIAKKLG